MLFKIYCSVFKANYYSTCYIRALKVKFCVHVRPISLTCASKNDKYSLYFIKTVPNLQVNSHV